MSPTAGVVAVQGNVAEHVRAIERAAAANGHDGIEVHEIRESGTASDCDLLALPGGESTTISRLIHDEGIAAEIRAHVGSGKPLLATCAGLIVASRDAADPRVETLGLLDVRVERNAFGRQRDSFEADLDVAGLDEPFPAVFIRAPAIGEGETGGESEGNGKLGDDDGAEVLARWDGRPVAVRQGPIVATAFHPELTGDPRLHDLAFFES